ncbi:hypothetical protein [Solirubrobacter soli]|uniref:hypothetical protein n=1 Tax=Solirubrobacter soli TaxID=363832 RepID=UPI00041648E9|nr:hypothetical protein [Solirubrobacter soli]
MLRLLPLALLAFVLFGSHPAQAAACGVPASRAVYETPEVQVFQKKANLIACFRPTGRQRVVGHFLHDTGTDEASFVYGVLGGRWLHKQDYATFAESADYRMDELVDLRTGQVAKALVMSEDGENEVVAVPGALVSATRKGVRVRFTDGRSQVLDTAPAEALAANGARVYWRTQAGPKSAVVAAPESEPARPLPRAHRTAGCSPRAGARLVLSDGLVVVTRVGDVTYGCRQGRTRKVGVVTDVRVVSDREVAYTRPGFTGVLDIASGKLRELDGPGISTGWTLVAGGDAGMRAWSDDQKAATTLAPGPVSDVAISDGFVAGVTYWLDASGAVQSHDAQRQAIARAAQAGCGVAPGRAVFETPEVQVRAQGDALVACYRPTGEEQVVEHAERVVGLHDGRWLHVDHTLIDLRTGQKVVAENAELVVAGALVGAGADGVVARYPDGRSTVLDTAPASALGAIGTRVYWRTAAGPSTALLPPVSRTSAAAPPARRIGRCTPRPGARLVLNQPPLVVTRAGATTYVCRDGRTRRVGAATSVAYMSDRELAYERRGHTGVLYVVSGKRHELAGSGPLTFTASALAAADGDGVRLWESDRSEPVRPIVGPVSDVALLGNAVFWLDAMGFPRYTAL